MTLRVTVTDLQTEETETKEVPAGDYLLICAEPCHPDHVQMYGTGTHVITVKGYGPRKEASAT